MRDCCIRARPSSVGSIEHADHFLLRPVRRDRPAGRPPDPAIRVPATRGQVHERVRTSVGHILRPDPAIRCRPFPDRRRRTAPATCPARYFISSEPVRRQRVFAQGLLKAVQRNLAERAVRGQFGISGYSSCADFGSPFRRPESETVSSSARPGHRHDAGRLLKDCCRRPPPTRYRTEPDDRQADTSGWRRKHRRKWKGHRIRNHTVTSPLDLAPATVPENGFGCLGRKNCSDDRYAPAGSARPPQGTMLDVSSMHFGA